MKKIFTLFIALIAFAAVFAQRGSSNNNYASNNWNTQADSRYFNHLGLIPRSSASP